MKNKIQFIFLVSILIFSGCKKKDIYHIKYSKDIYLPKFFKSDCGKLFDRPDIAISLDTFNLHTYMSPAHPLYAYCKDDVHIQQFFGSNESDRAPFYIGNIHTAVNANLELFTFNGFVGKYNRWVTGYFALKQPGGFTLLKIYETNTDQPTMLQPRMRDNYLLLWEETDRTPDTVEVTKPRTIEVQYCILKINANNTFTILPKPQSDKMIKEDFFADLPSAGSFTF